MFDGYHENEVIQSNTKQTTAPFFLIFPKKFVLRQQNSGYPHLRKEIFHNSKTLEVEVYYHKFIGKW